MNYAEIKRQNRDCTIGMVESVMWHRDVARALNVHHTTATRLWLKYQQAV